MPHATSSCHAAGELQRGQSQRAVRARTHNHDGGHVSPTSTSSIVATRASIARIGTPTTPPAAPATVLIKLHKLYKGLEKIVMESSMKGKDTRKTSKLTSTRMKKWSQYYRNAIVKHVPNIEATCHAIWTIFFHSISTVEDPHHDHCDINWCFFQQAKAEGVGP